LEVEQLEIKRKNDSLSGRGKIDMSREHDYSGTLDARADNLLDYFSSFRRSVGKSTSPIPVDVQATITSSNWDARGVVRVPDSSAISFTANFPLRIGTDWNAFQLAPLNLTVDFPSVFLAKAPQLFHPAIFRDGILSGRISVSETLQHPRIVGDVQLVNGKLSGDGWLPFNFVEASGRIAFTGNRASAEFLNVASKEADLSLRGEIDFDEISNVTVRINGATPIFDLTSQPIDCVNKIKIAPAVLTLAPTVTAFEFCGGLFQPGWRVSVHESTALESSAMSDSDGLARNFPLCLDTSPEEKTLLLGAFPRPETDGESSRSKQPEKRK
jgi:hypothetical protein